VLEGYSSRAQEVQAWVHHVSPLQQLLLLLSSLVALEASARLAQQPAQLLKRRQDELLHLAHIHSDMFPPRLLLDVLPLQSVKYQRSDTRLPHPPSLLLVDFHSLLSTSPTTMTRVPQVWKKRTRGVPVTVVLLTYANSFFLFKVRGYELP
jgi:hypothetical protein